MHFSSSEEYSHNREAPYAAVERRRQPAPKQDQPLKLPAAFLPSSKRRGLLAPPPLDFDIDIDQRHRRRRHSRNARCLTERLRHDSRQLFLHLAREPAYASVIKPIRDPALLG